jgi:hypothetical protein
MAIKVPRGRADAIINKIIDALKEYETANPRARIDVYRQNPVSVRIRIVDPAFKGLEKSERHTNVWRFLAALPEDVQGDISMLLLLSPEEKKGSMGNLEFDDPVRSAI